MTFLQQQLQGNLDSTRADALLTRTRLAQSLTNVGPQGVASASSSNVRLLNGQEIVLRSGLGLNNQEEAPLVLLNEGQLGQRQLNSDSLSQILVL